MDEEIKERIEMIDRGEVPEGYKKTKLGIIPENWEVGRLIEYAKITMGQSPSSINYNEDEIGLPLIQGNADIKGRYTNPRMYTSEITKTCEKGNIIMSVRAPVGEVAKSLHNACIGRGVCSLNPKDDDNYLYYYLIKSEKTWGRYSQGSTFESVNSKDIQNFNIIKPKHKEEQQKIAQILSIWDKAIELKEKLIEEKKEQKKGLMRRLLTGEVRLPGFVREWEEVKFNEAFIRIPSKKHQIKTNEYQESGIYPVVDQGKDKIIAYSNQKDKVLKVLKDGIIVFGDHTREIKYIDFDIIIGADGTQLLRTKKEFNVKFYYYSLLNKRIPNTGYNRHFKFLKEMEFYYPSLQEQKAITQILSTADKEIDLLTQELQQLKEQKKGLMQLLLTGKIRVPLQ